MKLIVMGPPGVGKGTQATMLVEELHIPHISTGDIFRQAIASQSPLGLEIKKVVDSGNLVSDELTAEVVKSRLSQPDCQDGFLLDGYPRTVDQAKTLSQITEELSIPIDLVINFDVDQDSLLERLSGRLVCRNCGTTYHATYAKPSIEGVCDKCSGEVYQREDDKPENIKTRLAVYFDKTMPVIEYYSKSQLLVQIDASGDKQTVFAKVKEVVGAKHD